MKSRIILFVAPCPLAGDLSTPANTPQRQKHFLWRVVNAPAPFYVVASMHDLRKSDSYVATEFNKEIDQSQKFIFERDPADTDPTDLWRKLNAHTTYPRGVPIQQKVRPSTFALLDRK